jgi:hypothetical protein
MPPYLSLPIVAAEPRQLFIDRIDQPVETRQRAAQVLAEAVIFDANY